MCVGAAWSLPLPCCLAGPWSPKPPTQTPGLLRFPIPCAPSHSFVIAFLSCRSAAGAYPACLSLCTHPPPATCRRCVHPILPVLQPHAPSQLQAHIPDEVFHVAARRLNGYQGVYVCDLCAGRVGGRGVQGCVCMLRLPVCRQQCHMSSDVLLEGERGRGRERGGPPPPPPAPPTSPRNQVTS